MRHIILLPLFIVLLVVFSNSALAKQKIALFGTDIALYEYEADFFSKFWKLEEPFDLEVVLMDYNLLHSDYLKQKKTITMKELIEKFLKEKQVTKIILPGDYYNLELPPVHPVKTRITVMQAIFELMKEKKVSVIGFCGGLAQSMGLDNIPMVETATLTDEVHSRGRILTQLIFSSECEKDTANCKNAELKKRDLLKVMVDPSSKIGRIIADVKDLEVTKNGWFVMYLTEHHFISVDLKIDTLNHMRERGYVISGFAPDGVIEIVEDPFGNFLFQSHPENLLIYHTIGKLKTGDPEVVASAVAMKKIFQAFLDE